MNKTIDGCIIIIKTVSTMYLTKVVIGHSQSPMCIKSTIIAIAIVEFLICPIIVIVHEI